MEIYIEKQLLNIVFSLILGLIFGILYDIIRIIHILCGIASYSGENAGMKRGVLPFIIFFAFDAVYMLCVTLLYSLFNYYAINGAFRAYILLPVCAGFLFYYFTLGRVVMFFSEALARFLRTVFRYTVVIPTRFVYSISKKVAVFIFRNTVGRMYTQLRKAYLRLRTERYRRNIKRDISFNFEDGGREI